MERFANGKANVMDPFGSLNDSEVHVWHVCSSEIVEWEPLHGVLSPAEKETAQSFRYVEDRLTYALAHGLLRHLLARYLGCSAVELNFSREPAGKPYLAGSEMAFNLSHSRGRVAIAIAKSSVGVDLEGEVTLPPETEFIHECFTLTEQRWVEQYAEERSRRFLRLWTIKEAVLKADGRGLGVPCHEVEVIMKEDGRGATVVLQGVEWVAYEVGTGAAYCLAVATRGTREIRLCSLDDLNPVLSRSDV